MNPDGADQEQHVAEPSERGFGGYALDFGDIVIDAATYFAEPRARVESRGEALQMAVQRQAHVEQDFGGCAGVAEAADYVEDEADRVMAVKSPTMV